MIAGCAGPGRPAPVSVLNSQHEAAIADKPISYTVKAGDTLYAIAWFSGNDYTDIARWNSLSKPYVIHPGQTLRLQAPPRVSKKQQSVNNMTGPTRLKKQEKSIDQGDSKAYCDCKPDVNKSSKPKKVTQKIIKGFPKRVDKWIWPAKGKAELANKTNQATQAGIDIYANHGSSIVAAAAGKVVYAGNALRGYGNLIIIKHTDSLLSAYAHNDRILVSERDWVKAGQEIGKMGNTGTTSVKLHFEIRYRGKSVDPIKYLPKK
ncbi:lipoprotein NlpD [Alteromonas lipolytica]|nr:lipoprotein NlpD [Alteromonas lipolytica]